MGDWSLYEYVAKCVVQFTKHIEPEDAYISQLIGNLEALSAGVTSVVDHCHLTTSEAVAESLLEATKKSGIRSYFCYARWEEFPNGSGRKEWQMAQIDRFAAQLKGSERITLGVGIDGMGEPFFDELKNDIFPLADKHGIDVFSTHYVGGPNLLGAGGANAFASRGLLENKSLLFVHANALEPSEYEAIKNSNSGISATPEIEMAMGHGDVVGFVAEDAGMRVGLGVDCASVIGGDFFTVMRTMLAYQRSRENEKHLQRGEVPRYIKRKAQDVFRMATLGGARSIRRENEIGSLEVGKRADIVLLDLTSPSMLGADRDPFQAIVMHATVADINRVIVGGEILVDRNQPARDGVFTKVKWSDQVIKVQESLARLRAKFKDWEREEEETYAGLIQGLGAIGLKIASE
ncbi:hypothetical protein FRC03_007559 [Tulasnella sp. 419]|nr:hypothetical protein FRC03_007559 [Tulasnella sp. 419]